MRRQPADEPTSGLRPSARSARSPKTSTFPRMCCGFGNRKFPQLKPLKRGGGRRYYRPEDIALLRRIRQCLYQDGYTIRGVQKLLREGGLGDGGGAEGATEETTLFPLEPLPPPVSKPPRRMGPSVIEPTVPAVDRAALEEARHELLEGARPAPAASRRSLARVAPPALGRYDPPSSPAEPGRSVAQPGSASAWGAEGREFESLRSDQFSAFSAGVPPMDDPSVPKIRLEPWQWPEEHWRKLVDRVRAGRSLRPSEWPGGARCAVALSFDSDHETSDLREGGKSIGRLAWGQFGARVGVPRILEAARTSTESRRRFYVPAVTALLHPDEQRRVVAEGHEIGIHGWIHELNSILPYEAERDLMLRAADVARKDQRRAAGRAAHARPGISAGTRWRSRPRWASSTIRR